jgi:orotate phosphoribosyltransferase
MNDLYERIYHAGCIKFGEFKLKSGIMSPVYCDLRMLVSAPAVLAEIGKALGERAIEIGCDRIAGIPYGGVPIAVAASIASGIPMIYPRKEVKDHGTRNAIEGTFKEGEKVLVIDDLVTSGMSFGEAVEPLKAAGLVVEDVLVILDREQGGAKIIEKAGYKLHTLGTLSEFVSTLVAAGKLDAEMQAKVADFIVANQFA